MISEEVQKAYEVAKKAQSNAYAKYSNFVVGAAIKFKGTNKIYMGCNVENASYGATICAEQSAIVSGISQQGKAELEFVVVITNTDPVTGPCALCLQMIAEFSTPELPIYMANQAGIQVTKRYGDLLSSPFSEIPPQV